MIEGVLAVSSNVWYYGSTIVLGLVTSFVYVKWPNLPAAKRRRFSIITIGVLIIALATPVTVSKLVTIVEHHRDTRLEVVLLVKAGDQPTWGRHAYADPGQVVAYRLEVTNVGPGSAEGLIVGANMADYMSWVPNSTHIMGAADARPVDDDNEEHGDLISGGIRVGDYRPGETVVVEWAMKINEIEVFEYLGKYTLKSVGIARVPDKTNEVYNTAWVDVHI